MATLAYKGFTSLDNYKLFAQNLKHFRKTRSDHTQTTMAEALGISERGYQRYEMGTAYPRPHLMAQIAGLVNTSVAELIEATSRDMTNAPMPQPPANKMGELEQFFMKVMAKAAQGNDPAELQELRTAKAELEALKADPLFAALQKATVQQREQILDQLARSSSAQRPRVRLALQQRARSKKAKERSSR